MQSLLSCYSVVDKERKERRCQDKHSSFLAFKLRIPHGFHFFRAENTVTPCLLYALSVLYRVESRKWFHLRHQPRKRLAALDDRTASPFSIQADTRRK